MIDFGEIALWALPAVLAITLHEAAHGYVAKVFGDRTAEIMGRITLNPLRHIDLIGTIVLPLVLYLMSSGAFLFGWAKPVPVNFANLRRPRRDMIWVAAAGPLSNLAMAIGWTVVLAFAIGEGVFASETVARVAKYGIVWNVALMVLNLLPILPLDGGRILAGLLPPRAASAFSRLEPYGLLIVVALMATGVLSKLLYPVRSAVAAGLTVLFQAVLNTGLVDL